MADKGRGRRRANREGSIYQRKDGRWCAAAFLLTPDGTYQRKHFYGRTRQEVHDKLIEAQRKSRRGVPASMSSPTVGEYLDYWLREVATPRLRPTTLRSYETYVRLYLVPGLGKKRLDRLSARDIRQFLNRMHETCQCCAQGQDAARARTPGKRARCCAIGPCCRKVPSDRTVQYVYAILRSTLSHAVREDELERNVAKNVQVSAGQRPKLQPLTLDETRALLRAAGDDELHALWVLALTLGLRRGELLGLQWDDLDLDGGTVEIRRSLARAGGKLYTAPPKTRGSAQVLPLLGVAVQALRDHQTRQQAARTKAGPRWQETGFVFTSNVGTPIDPRNVNRAFTQLLDSAGVRRVRLHDLRHGAATLLLALGVDMRTIMEILRHSAIAVTANTYAHVDLALQREALDRLGQALEDR